MPAVSRLLNCIFRSSFLKCDFSLLRLCFSATDSENRLADVSAAFLFALVSPECVMLPPNSSTALQHRSAHEQFSRLVTLRMQQTVDVTSGILRRLDASFHEKFVFLRIASWNDRHFEHSRWPKHALRPNSRELADVDKWQCWLVPHHSPVALSHLCSRPLLACEQSGTFGLSAPE